MKHHRLIEAIERHKGPIAPPLMVICTLGSERSIKAGECFTIISRIDDCNHYILVEV